MLTTDDVDRPFAHETLVGTTETRVDGTTAIWFPFSLAWAPDSSALLAWGWMWDAADTSLPEGLVTVPLDDSGPNVIHLEGADSGEPDAIYWAHPWLTGQSWRAEPTR